MTLPNLSIILPVGAAQHGPSETSQAGWILSRALIIGQLGDGHGIIAPRTGALHRRGTKKRSKVGCTQTHVVPVVSETAMKADKPGIGGINNLTC